MRGLGIVVASMMLGVLIGVVTADKALFIQQEIVQRKCLWPVSDGTFTFEPYSKTCFSVEGDVRKPVDCNTVLTIKQFQIVKHCF